MDRPTSAGSPGLQQYHHGSKSPEEQRRESFTYPSDYATHLPPIQSVAQYENQQSNTRGVEARPDYGPDVSRGSVDHVGTETTYAGHSADTEYMGDHPNLPRLERRSTPYQDAERYPPQSTERRASNTPYIENETAAAPGSRTPNKEEDPSVDAETARAILAAANEHGTRGVRTKATTEQTPELEPLPTKKKAPTAKVGTKKGVARKPSQKKRRLEDDEGRSMSPAATASRAGASARAGKTPNSHSNTPQPTSSPTPASREESLALEAEEEGDDGSDNELYCICRKPDNHSWMIACDGGCDDWFHGKCVKMKEEEGELIDKYICPNCHRAGKGVTTWKPGCRRDGCNKPALIRKDKQSKYCSEECGREFMREMLALDSERPTKKQKRGKGASGTNLPDGADADEEEDLGPRGGALRPGDVKALLDASKNVDEFRSLGDGVLSPPATISPEKTGFESTTGTNGVVSEEAPPQPQPPSYTLTPPEAKKIQDIADEQDKLSAKKLLLRDREHFVKMVIEQVSRHAERLGLKAKEICGYDSRLAWSYGEFQAWRDSNKGQDVLRLGTLDAAVEPQTNGVKPESGTTNGDSKDGDVKMQDDFASSVDAVTDDGRLCTKKRCEQHRQWQKNELTGVRADIVDVGDEAAGLAKEERELREQAFRRWRGEQGSKQGGEQQASEGWVEVL